MEPELFCSVFSLRGLEQRVDRDRSSGRAVRFASSNLKQLTCIQAFYLVSILTQSTCKNMGYLIYIYTYMSDMLPDMFIDAEMERVREEKRKEEKRREEERRSKKRKSQKKEGPGARKVGKSQNAVFFQ